MSDPAGQYDPYAQPNDVRTESSAIRRAEDVSVASPRAVTTLVTASRSSATWRSSAEATAVNRACSAIRAIDAHFSLRGPSMYSGSAE